MIALIVLELLSILFYSYSTGQDFFNQDILSGGIMFLEIVLIVILAIIGIVWAAVSLIRKRRDPKVFLLLIISAFTLFSFPVAEFISPIFYSKDKTEYLDVKGTGLKESHTRLKTLFEQNQQVVLASGDTLTLGIGYRIEGNFTPYEPLLVNPLGSHSLDFLARGIETGNRARGAFEAFSRGSLVGKEVQFKVPEYEDYAENFVGSWSIDENGRPISYGGVAPVLIYVQGRLINGDYFSSSVLEKYQ